MLESKYSGIKLSYGQEITSPEECPTKEVLPLWNQRCLCKMCPIEHNKKEKNAFCSE